MNDLIDRYVHQVGRYLPANVRADIEAELRSQIQDQLDDRYQGTPAEGDIVAVLSDLGDPRRLAGSYREDRYLVGPALYPTMITVLQYGWLIIPSVVIFLNVFAMLISPEAGSVLSVLTQTGIAVLQATGIFTSVVVLIFAILQHTGIDLHEPASAFEPLALPKVDDPGSVDRVEAAGGIAVGMLVTLVLLYFVSVGGLTIRFNLSDPGDVIAFPILWGVLLIVNGIAQIILHRVVLRRNRWGSAVWLLQTVLEVFGIVCLYFVLFEPLYVHFSADAPSLSALPEIIAVSFALITLVSRGSRLVRLWNYPTTASAPVFPGTEKQAGNGNP